LFKWLLGDEEVPEAELLVIYLLIVEEVADRYGEEGIKFSEKPPRIDLHFKLIYICLKLSMHPIPQSIQSREVLHLSLSWVSILTHIFIVESIKELVQIIKE
jgi:hypothetical protein